MNLAMCKKSECNGLSVCKARPACDVQDQKELAEHLRCARARRKVSHARNRVGCAPLLLLCFLLEGQSMQVAEKCEQSLSCCYGVVFSWVVYVRFGMFRVHG